MARPSRTMQSYRIPDPLVERIDRAADVMKVAKVDIVVEALEMYLAKVEPLLKKAKGDQP